MMKFYPVDAGYNLPIYTFDQVLFKSSFFDNLIRLNNCHMKFNEPATIYFFHHQEISSNHSNAIVGCLIFAK